MTTHTRVKSYIGGGPKGAPEATLFENLNPATGEVLSLVESADAALVNEAVERAQAAFPAWRAMTGAERGRILVAAAARLRERNDELAHLEVLDTGKPISEANCVDVASAADCLEYFGGIAASLHGQHVDLGPGAAPVTIQSIGLL